MVNGRGRERGVGEVGKGAAHGRYAMKPRVTPMIHVPDVRQTVDWYKGVGFEVVNLYDDGCGDLSFAILSFGDTNVMFNQGGHPSTRERREVDLYVYTSEVDRLYDKLKGRVDIVEGPHDTFYGMREIIIRDLNRFWITFGQESAFTSLIGAVTNGDPAVVRSVLSENKFSQNSLTKALISCKDHAIKQLLIDAGGVTSHSISAESLERQAGLYQSPTGMRVEMILKDGSLSAVPGEQNPIDLFAVSDTSFRAIYFENIEVNFRVEEGKSVGFTFTHGEDLIEHVRIS